MTPNNSTQYRRTQTLGIIASAILNIIGTIAYIQTQTWTATMILAIVSLLLLLIVQRAAKLEVLTNLGITLDSYEYTMAKKTASTTRRRS